MKSSLPKNHKKSTSSRHSDKSSCYSKQTEEKNNLLEEFDVKQFVNPADPNKLSLFVNSNKIGKKVADDIISPIRQSTPRNRNYIENFIMKSASSVLKNSPRNDSSPSKENPKSATGFSRTDSHSPLIRQISNDEFQLKQDSRKNNVTAIPSVSPNRPSKLPNYNHQFKQNTDASSAAKHGGSQEEKQAQVISTIQQAERFGREIIRNTNVGTSTRQQSRSQTPPPIVSASIDVLLERAFTLKNSPLSSSSSSSSSCLGNERRSLLLNNVREDTTHGNLSKPPLLPLINKEVNSSALHNNKFQSPALSSNPTVHNASLNLENVADSNDSTGPKFDTLASRLEALKVVLRSASKTSDKA